ncbi:hypothetical protein HDV57DRAFT_245647 [Trichoderma longibrachiatum]|uniref:Uncharacterized protein n=1 Tax=Trichoderma longibrachiatum ATCC 18648 TaxID=983965 RepID=A0A2T4C9Z2_TRILO|nr:hypothetical protein M440DRAFT_1191213 [Trichoderma longibrachiatum ATCC 18648]
MRRAERRMGQTSWPAAGKCHIHMCVRNHTESPSQIRHTSSRFLLSPESQESRRREGTSRRGGGATGGLPWPSLVFFFLFSFGIHFLSLVPASVCACVVRCACLGQQKAAAAAPPPAGTRRFLITCIYGWPFGRKGPSRPHLCLRNGGL